MNSPQRFLGGDEAVNDKTKESNHDKAYEAKQSQEDFIGIDSTPNGSEDRSSPSKHNSTPATSVNLSSSQTQGSKIIIEAAESDEAAKDTEENAKITTQAITKDTEFEVDNCTAGNISMCRIRRIIATGVGSTVFSSLSSNI